MKRIHTLLILSTLLLSLDAVAQPAVLPGTVDVSAIGAVSYTIPVEVVPGTNGMQPNLAIVYNSMAGIDILGYKWSLMGISSITRTPQNRFYDNVINPIAFDTSDRFSLDGNRMLLVEGNSYQCSANEYCFEMEDYSRIYRNGSGNDIYFERVLANGSVVRYGGTSNSRLTTQNGVCLKWMVSQVIDGDGNMMQYIYGKTNGEIWLSRIEYTILSDGTPAYARVDFEYEPMNPPNDAFVCNQLIRQSKRLRNIFVKYQGNKVRIYHFSYSNSVPSDRLSSVKLFESDSVLLTTTTIEWNNNSSPLTSDETVTPISGTCYVVAGNFDNDRIYDIFSIDSVSGQSYIIKRADDGTFSTSLSTGYQFPVSSLKNLSAFDINGDGIDEVVFQDTNNHTYYSLDVSQTIPSLSSIFTSSASLTVGDFDGDGIVEPVAFVANSNQIAFKYLEGTSNTSYTFQKQYNYCRSGDFDGDGKTDLMFLSYDDSCHIYTYNIRTHTWDLIEREGFPGASQYVVVGDFNGDGMSDLLFLPGNEAQWKMAVRYGPHNWSLQTIPELDGSHLLSGDIQPKYSPVISDINGDGRCDILQPVDNNIVIYIISNGFFNQTFQYDGAGTFSYSTGQTFYSGHFSMGDFDGNGIADMLFSTTQSGSIKYFRKNQMSGCFVKQITDASGRKTKLEYSTISLMQHRYLGTGMNWMQLPLAKNLIVSNGVGGFDTTSFYYAGAQYDMEKLQFIGFNQFVRRNNQNISINHLSRVHGENNTTFALLMPDSVVNYVTNVPLTSNSTFYDILLAVAHPANGTIITKTININGSLVASNALGTTSFLPFVPYSIQYDHLRNTKTMTQTDMDAHREYWRPMQQTTTTGYIAGRSEIVTVQQADYKYMSFFMHNGRRVVMPAQKRTQCLNAPSDQYPRLDTTNYQYSDFGHVTSMTYGDNCGFRYTITNAYNQQGLLTTKEVEPFGEYPRIYRQSYDPTKRFVVWQADPDGNEVTRTFDPATGLCLSETDINGLTTAYEYDHWGRLVEATFPDATTRTMTYVDATGGLPRTNCYTVVEENGKPQTRIYYDLLGRKVHTYVAGQGYRDVVYNRLGQVEQQTLVPYVNVNLPDASKIWKTMRYDLIGRIVKDSSHYTETSFQYGIDARDFLYKETVINKTGAATSKFLDAAGRVYRVKDDGGSVTYNYAHVMLHDEKVYDRMQIGMRNVVTTIVTDSRGNRIQLTDPDAGNISSTYNGWGEMLTQTDGKGDVTTMTYDHIGRVVSKAYTLGGTTDTYTYSYGTAAPAKGRLTSVAHNGNTCQQIAYDALGRVASNTKYIDGNTYAHQYTYNSDGQLSTVQFPSGFTIQQGYDDNGQLHYIIDLATNKSIYDVSTRNDNGQPTKCWLGSDMGVQYTYDDWGMPTEIKYGYKELVPGGQPTGFGGGNSPQFDPTNPIVIDDSIPGIGGDPIPEIGDTYRVGSQFSVLQYTYDNYGMITRKKDTKTNQQEDYTYDILGRLTSFTVNNTQTRNFAYQNNGNISRNGLLGTSDYTYGSSQPHAVTMVLDETGALPTSRCDVAYNNRNRPASISDNGWSVELFYGSGLQREKSVLKHGDTVKNTTYFIAKDSEHEINSTFGRYIDYIYAEGRIVALHVYNTTANADSIYYVQSDLLGSCDRVVRSNKTVMQSSHFDPWGNRMSTSDWTSGQSGTDFSFHRGFTGHEHYDRFGIINMNARLYDPVIGRFFSPDPQVQNSFSTQGLNRYSYCGNNPVMFNDPDGEFALLFSLALTYATIVGGINLGIHISQGDVHNAGQAIGYIGQGVAAGFTLGFMQCAGLYAMTTPLAPLYAGAGTMNIVTTGVSMLRDSENAWRIFCGNFYFDENIAHGFSQAFTRFTTEMMQSWAGYNATQIRNFTGNVNRVDYLGGATFATKEHSIYHRGFTIGNYINMSIKGEITMPFRDCCLYVDQMYLHEYGHSIQSQLTGFSYLLSIGLPSLISAAYDKNIEGDPYRASTHGYFYTETWANRIASRYFSKYYGYEWNEYDGYPFHDYR